MSELFNSLTAVTTAPYTSIGAIRRESGCTYIYGKMKATAGAVVAGALVFRVDTTEDLVGDIAASRATCVHGVAMAAHAALAGTYGWFQTWGDYADAITTTAGSVSAAGYSLYASAGGVFSGVSSGTAIAPSIAIGYAADACSATTGTVAVFLKLRS